MPLICYRDSIVTASLNPPLYLMVLIYIKNIRTHTKESFAFLYSAIAITVSKMTN